MFNSNFEKRKPFKSISFLEMKKLIKEFSMLICSNCANNRFFIKVETVTALDKAVLSADFGIANGNLLEQVSTILDVSCQSCGQSLDIESLRRGKFCYECSKPLGHIYRKHKTKNRYYHLECALASLPENHTEIKYDEE